MTTTLDAFNDRIKLLESTLNKIDSDIDYKMSEINEKAFRKLFDLQKVVESRPTFDYVDQSIQQTGNKINHELTSKFERKLNEFDCREQIYAMMNRESDQQNLVNQVAFCLKQVGEMKKISDGNESKSRWIEIESKTLKILTVDFSNLEDKIKADIIESLEHYKLHQKTITETQDMINSTNNKKFDDFDGRFKNMQEDVDLKLKLSSASGGGSNQKN